MGWIFFQLIKKTEYSKNYWGPTFVYPFLVCPKEDGHPNSRGTWVQSAPACYKYFGSDNGWIEAGAKKLCSKYHSNSSIMSKTVDRQTGRYMAFICFVWYF